MEELADLISLIDTRETFTTSEREDISRLLQSVGLEAVETEVDYKAILIPGQKPVLHVYALDPFVEEVLKRMSGESDVGGFVILDYEDRIDKLS